MAKKTPFDVSKVHYSHIRDLAFNYSIPEDVPLPQNSGESIHFNLEIVKTIGLEEKVIRFIFTIELKAYEKGKKDANAPHVTDLLFNLKHMISRILNTKSNI